MGIGLTIIHQHVPQVAVPSPYIQPNTQNWQPSIVNQSPVDVQIVSPNQPAYQYEPQTLMEIVPQQNVQVIPCVQQSNYASLTPQGQTCVHVSSPPPPSPTPSGFIVSQQQGQIQSQQGHLNLDILLFYLKFKDNVPMCRYNHCTSILHKANFKCKGMFQDNLLSHLSNQNRNS